MRRLIGLVVLLLSACASAPVPPIVLPALQLAPSSLQAGQWAQRLTLQEAPEDAALPGVERQLDVLLEIDADRLQLVALALQQRVLTLHWDGHQLRQQRHALLPATVPAERVLRDIVFVMAGLEALQAPKVLPEGWRVQEQGRERRLLDSQGRAQLISTTEVQGEVWRIDIDNRAERYRLRIESRPLAAAFPS